MRKLEKDRSRNARDIYIIFLQKINMQLLVLFGLLFEYLTVSLDKISDYFENNESKNYFENNVSFQFYIVNIEKVIYKLNRELYTSICREETDKI